MANIIWRILTNLQLFAEEGGTGGTESAATGVTGSAAVNQPQEPQPALRTRRGTPIYETEQPATPEQSVPAQEETVETYESLVKGRFKAEYDADVQGIVQARLRTAKAREAKTAALIKILGDRYGIDVSDADNLDYEGLTQAVVADQKYLETEAAEQGLSTEQLATIKKLQWQVDQQKANEQASIQEQRQRALFGRIAREAEELRNEFPEIDIRNEIQDSRFMGMMETGVPVRNAYIALHPEILQRVTQAAAQQAQQRVAAQVQAGMRRPTENGVGGQTASYTQIDIRDPKVRQELRRRVRAGEKVTLPD